MKTKLLCSIALAIATLFSYTTVGAQQVPNLENTTPTVTTSLTVDSIDFGIIVNTTSLTKSFYLQGENLTSDLYVRTNDSYEYSVTPDTLIPINGSIADSIYVTYRPQAAGISEGVVYITGGGLTDNIYIVVSGEATGVTLDAPKVNVATNITKDGFTANWDSVTNANTYELQVWHGNIALVENFDSQTSTGGNDNQWSGNVATGTVSLSGWTLTRVSGGDHCIKLGTSSNRGSATTPALGYSGNYNLKFRAGSWGGDARNIVVTISEGATLSYNGGTAADSIVVPIDSAQFAWRNITINNMNTTSQITFAGIQANRARFFLDSIAVSNDTMIVGSPFSTANTYYTLSNLDSAITYHYRVKASGDNGGYSNWSEQISVTTGGTSTQVITPTLSNIFFDGEIIQNPDNETIILFNIIGEMITIKEGDIHMSSYPNGIYIIKTRDHTLKIVK